MTILLFKMRTLTQYVLVWVEKESPLYINMFPHSDRNHLHGTCLFVFHYYVQFHIFVNNFTLAGPILILI